MSEFEGRDIDIFEFMILGIGQNWKLGNLGNNHFSS